MSYFQTAVAGALGAVVLLAWQAVVALHTIGGALQDIRNRLPRGDHR